DKDKMIPLAYDLTEYFNKRASGFFPYTDQALNPEQAERLLNAMTEIIASPDADVEEQLQAIK
ncbi:MAG TPA: sugar ABC transporter, partial [Bacteroidales bacterium]|nr:sugar ABC transporter [Bacteroidales bacterium]